MASYEEAAAYAAAHGFPMFTPLQEQAFRMPGVCDTERDVFVVGATSSGKTLIPLLLYGLAYERALREGKPRPHMLFAVPYRALAAQKVQELRRFFRDYDLEIVQSTGEYRQSDGAIRQGHVDIAVVINEKVFRFAACDETFLGRYDFLVLDEVGLVDSEDRGMKLDFIISWTHAQRDREGQPRMIALGTPFYDWTAYVERLGFILVQDNERPVPLEETSAVFVNKVGVQSVEGRTDVIRRARYLTEADFRRMRENGRPSFDLCPERGESCLFTESARLDPLATCPHAGGPCTRPIELIDVPKGVNRLLYGALLKVCDHHLALGHQILVFMNNRFEVMRCCALLYERFKDRLRPVPEPGACREAILEACDLLEDDVRGVMDPVALGEGEVDLFQALSAGIGFHSAALPNELRAYVEGRFLDDADSDVDPSERLSIVCSTETLAYGINSAVDVVVVADLQKIEGGSARLLKLNEFQNYSGRAGRLRPGQDREKARGYVYTFIRKSEQRRWAEIREGEKTPRRLFSNLYQDTESKSLAFFLLNFMSADETHGRTTAELQRILERLPSPNVHYEDLMGYDIADGLAFLIREDLARKDSGRRNFLRRGAGEERYVLTDRGESLRGFLVGEDDYGIIKQSLSAYLPRPFDDPDDVGLLRLLITSRHAERSARNIYARNPMSADEMRAYLETQSVNPSAQRDWLAHEHNIQRLAILGASVAWIRGKSAHAILRQFGIPYAIVSNLAQSLSYLVEVASELLPAHMEERYEESRELYERFDGAEEEFFDRLDQRIDDIRALSLSLRYGINTAVAAELEDYFRESDDPSGEVVSEAFNLDDLEPIKARHMRRVIGWHLFFTRYPSEEDLRRMPAEDAHNFRSTRHVYEDHLRRERPLVRRFFNDRFSLGLSTH